MIVCHEYAGSILQAEHQAVACAVALLAYLIVVGALLVEIGYHADGRLADLKRRAECAVAVEQVAEFGIGVGIIRLLLRL